MTFREAMAYQSNRDIERNDAEKVDKAIEAIGQNDLTTARHLLEEVVANTPENYVYSYEEGDQLVIKFWNRDEFIQYVIELRGREAEKDVIGILSAYPRAYYYWAYIDVQEGKYESALEKLETCLKLEPDQPSCFCEMAVVYSALGQHEKAFLLYDQALKVRPHITAKTRARALRGKGVQLIELGKIDLAEECLKESLKYDPDSIVARNELLYIFHLKSEGVSAPLTLVTTTSNDQDVCASCGKELTRVGGKARVVNVGDKILFVCERCRKKQTKRWWEFWK